MRAPLLSLLLSAAFLAGCGAQPLAPRVQMRSSAIHVQSHRNALEAPVKAIAALRYAHAAARQLDPKALFTCLTGRSIGTDGTPAKGGKWELQYVGDTVAAPAGAPSNPYVHYTRRIQVVILETGEAQVSETVEEGIPLGLQLLDNPLPQLDSDRALELTRQNGPGATQGPVGQMTLSGQIGAQHFQRLVWKVSLQSQGLGGRALTLDANTGEVLSH